MKRVAVASFVLGAIVSSIATIAVLKSRTDSASRAGAPFASVSSSPNAGDPLAASSGSACPACPVCPKLGEIPLLPAPTWDRKLPEQLVTNHEGEVLVKWDNVLGARNFEVLVEDATGKAIKKYTSLRNKLYLKYLPVPKDKDQAHYLVRVATVNATGNIGPAGKSRDLLVKKPLDLTAPRIKEVRIED